MYKRIISLIILLTLIIGGMTTLMSCKQEEKNITLEFVSDPINSGSKAQHTYTVNWDDDVFTVMPTEFSPQIAKTSMVLSAAAFSSSTLLDDLKTLGFEKNAKFNYGDGAADDEVGMVMSSREINNQTLIAVVFRGTTGKEWYSNFDINSSTEHNGFSKAADFAMNKLEKYLVNYGIDRDNVKFMVTGHSRGAAVANLVSARLIDNYGSDKIYAYTFATPNTTKDTSSNLDKYKGIFNFVNPQDFISHVPLSSWGYTKYGTTIEFSNIDTDDDYEQKLSIAKLSFEKFTGRELKTFESSENLSSFLESAYKLAPTVDDYYNKKYNVGKTQLSLYDYMMTIAKILNDEDTITNGLIIFDTLESDFAPMTEYLINGIEMNSLLLNISYDNSLIAYAHSCETYLAWLDAYTSDL